MFLIITQEISYKYYINKNKILKLFYFFSVISINAAHVVAVG